MTVFPVPQFPLKPDEFGVRHYANVCNKMEVVASGGTYHVALAVPTGLFTVMKEVMKIPPGEEVKLLLIEDSEVDAVTDEEKQFYVFSLLYGENGLFDLWQYSPGTVPRWVFDPSYFV